MSDVIEFKQKYRELCQGGLYHRGPFIYGDEEAFLQCEACKSFLTAMAVLKQVIGSDRRLNMQIEEKKRHLERIANKCKTKCHHCGKMTEINK